jgi:hypothetical protein
MTTAQLIVLWYAALLIITLLLAGALELLPAAMIGHICVAIVVFAAVLIYSLKQHPLARRKYVALGVLLPPLAIGVVGGAWMLQQQRQAEREAARQEQDAERMAQRGREAFDRALKAEIQEAVRAKRRDGSKVTVTAPSIGVVEFPARMSDDEIARALEAHVLGEKDRVQGR